MPGPFRDRGTRVRIDRLLFALYAISVALPSALAHAQPPIAGPVRILIGYSDEASYVVARLLGDSISEAAGQPVVVERKPGASGRIAAEALKHAAPDGTTLMFTPVGIAVLAPLVFAKPGFDTLKDFAPITQVATFRYAFVVAPTHPAHSLADYVAWAKANPAQSTYGTGGGGTIPHFFGVMIGRETGIEMLHVPYKGSSPMTADLMGGQIASGVDALANVVELHRAGRLRILAVSGAERAPGAPDLPTFREQGLPSVDAEGWIGMFAPAGTPPATIRLLQGAITKALRAPAMRERLVAMGGEATGTTPEELAAIVAADTARWRPVIKASGFSAD
jgi:tripartite-type tricarboxylate transporter receptor subunit TctC